jgi:hypothetical protein
VFRLCQRGRRKRAENQHGCQRRMCQNAFHDLLLIRYDMDGVSINICFAPNRTASGRPQADSHEQRMQIIIKRAKSLSLFAA